MESKTIRLVLVKHLHLVKAPLISAPHLETSRPNMLDRCHNLLTELRRYATSNPHLLLLENRLQNLQYQANLSAEDLRQQLVTELNLALTLFK